MSTRVVSAPIEGPFASSTRRRPHARIGGASSRLPRAARAALVNALGPGASVLEPTPVPTSAGDSNTQLVADFDACWLGGRRLEQPADFAAHLDPAGLRELDGAFALAWYDAAGALCLARDPMGERSLFYAHTPAGFVFASSVAALLATGLVPREPDLVGIAQFLSCAYVTSGRTLVAGIRALLPGELLRVVEGEREGERELSRERYWLPPGEDAVASLSDEAALREDLRARLEAALARRLPPGELTEPVGASLSGGLDSSLIVALAASALARRGAPALRTYSISFGADYPNELRWSSMVAAHCKTEHTIVELSSAAIVRHMDAVAASFDRPVGDPLSVPNGLLFRFVAAEVGVLLNGEGGDPCFGGPKNLPMVLAEFYGDALNHPHADFWRERSYLRSHQRLYDDLPELLSPDARAQLADAPLERALAPLFGDPRWASFVNKLMMMNLVLKGGHHILPKVDALSSVFGVHARSPLFDRRVVEAAFRLPPQLKLRGAVEKYLLKQAVWDLLPTPILERPKAGMGVPVEAWFRGPLLSHARERLLDGLGSSPLFSRTYLERLVDPRRSMGLRERRGPKIWLLLTLEAWLRCVLAPGAASTATAPPLSEQTPS